VKEQPLLDTSQREAIRQRLIGWFLRGHRVLPWRSEPTPYRVWISEIMLQQTRVDTVVPYFERFMARFPDVAALARADIDDVLGLWSGLGYYSRARNLHRTAQLLVQAGHGELPAGIDALQKLPGIGRYTAGAIASIAFGLPAPILDGNAIRVLSRLADVAGDVAASATQRELWRLAALLVPADQASAFNQGLMELGATVCTPKGPSCKVCPLCGVCLAFAAGTVHLRPAKTPKKPPRPVSMLAVMVEHGGRLLLLKRPTAGLFGGLWDVVTAEHASAAPSPTDAARAVAAATGLHGAADGPLGRFEHVLSHRLLTVTVFRFAAEAALAPDALGGYEEARWVGSEDELAAMGLARLTRKVVELARAPVHQAELPL
jgi:A/G-specific adenine glycosylase